MWIRIILLLWIFFSCAKVAPPKPVILPPTKTIRPDLVEDTIFSRGYMSGYDIWEFLRMNPSERDVIDTFGLPDSPGIPSKLAASHLLFRSSNLTKQSLFISYIERIFIYPLSCHPSKSHRFDCLRIESKFIARGEINF